MDETRHMIIFDVLSWKSPVGEKGERLRLLSLIHISYSEQQAEIQKIILENAMVNIREIILNPNVAATSLKEKILINSN